MNKLDLCAKCPNAKSVDDPTGFALAEQLLGASLPQTTGSLTDELTCPACGFTQSEFKKLGRLGCPACYDVFENELGPVLRAMHRGLEHKGKVPKNYLNAKRRLAKIQELEASLAEAVLAERFEEAAAIRDQIKSLKEI
jgi:protein arginine kinase activator